MNNYLLNAVIVEEAPKTIANLLYIAVGVLSSVVAYMYISHRNELKELNKQSKIQEVETLKILSELTNFLKEQQSTHNEIKIGVNSIDKVTLDTNKTINMVAKAIQDKILKM